MAPVGGTKIAGDNETVDNYFVVQAKDANGTLLNGKSSSISDLALEDLGDEGFDSDDNAAGDEIDPFDGVGAYEYLQNLSASVCSTDEESDDTGETYSIAFELNELFVDTDIDLTSNSLNITCGESSEDARVTKVTAEATEGDLVYEEAGYDAGDDDGVLMLTATVVSANGSAMGDGSGLSCDDFAWSIAFTDDAFEDESTIVDDEDGDVSEGVCDLGYLARWCRWRSRSW